MNSKINSNIFSCYSTQVDDKQRISFGLRMNQSREDQQEVEINIGVKLYSSAKTEHDLRQNKTNEGQLMLTIVDNGYKMLLTLQLPPDHITTEGRNIFLSEWRSSERNEDSVNLSLMNNDWHNIDITFHHHKTFTLTIDNKSHRQKVTWSRFSLEQNRHSFYCEHIECYFYHT